MWELVSLPLFRGRVREGVINFFKCLFDHPHPNLPPEKGEGDKQQNFTSANTVCVGFREHMLNPTYI
jgi:hypothetical protein